MLGLDARTIAHVAMMTTVAGALTAGCAGGCGDPRERFAETTAALSRGELDVVARHVHPQYSDPVGDRARLLDDLAVLAREIPTVSTSEVEVVRGPSGPVLVGRLEVHLVGPPEWTCVGPLRLELENTADGLAIRSGFLDDLRNLQALFAARRAALEANDAEAIGRLIHPEYADGDLDRAQAIERLRADLAGVPLRITPRSYWAEVRGLDAHIDERYVLRLGDEEHAAIGRFTARREAGRWRIYAGLYPAGPD